MWRLVKPIAGPNEIVRGSDIVGRVRNDGTPTIAASARLRCPHQPELQRASPVSIDHADPAEISRVFHVRRRDQSGKGDRYALTERQPPMPPIEWRHWCAAKERKTMKIGENVGNVVILCVNLAYPVHRPHSQLAQRSICAMRPWTSTDAGGRRRPHHLPSMTLNPSQTAPTNPVTITVMTALNV
jgi:hypothetical protein